MPHFAVVVPPYIGHLRPMCVLSRAIARRGHRVTMLSLHDSEPWIERAHLDFVIYGKEGFPPGEWRRRMSRLGQMTGYRAALGAIRLMTDHARVLVREAPALLTQLKADGILADQVCYGSECVALQTNLPFAVACNAFPLHHESGIPPYSKLWPYNPALWARTRNVIANAVNLASGFRMYRFLVAHRRSVGLPRPRIRDFNEMPPSLAQVSQVPEFLDFPRWALPDHFHYTAPWIESAPLPVGRVTPCAPQPASSELSNGARGATRPASTRPLAIGVQTESNTFPWERLDGRPLIYASLGTLQNRLDHLYRTIAEACDGLNAQLVIALGRPNEAAPTADFPGAPIVVPFAPQAEMLARASLVITHAGLNTSLETLQAGVPMVCLPITNEQPGIAARLQRLGVATVIPLNCLSAPRLRQAVEHEMATLSFRERARSAAHQLQSLDGPGMAAQIVEAALVQRQRTTRATWSRKPG